jgi:glycosyltransferase involved in cell wall biosynthesis
MTPKISIIIPTYQHAGELPGCLESIFGQTFTDFEVIVVNDGSTDNTAEVLVPYMSRITIIEQPPRGASRENRGNAARNRGARDARGEFLLFCDADIIMRPDFLEKSLAALQAHPEASYAYVSFKFGWKTFRLWPFDADRLRKVNYIHTTSLMRRTHFPGFDESIKKLQDWDLWLTMLEQGRSGVWIPEVLMTAIPHRGIGISTWVPRFFYRIPWRSLGIRVGSVERYVAAEKIIKAKHHLDMLSTADAMNGQMRDDAGSPDTIRKTFGWALALMAGVEVLSLISYLLPQFAPYAFGAVVLAVATTALTRFEYAVLALFGELMIGSQGGYLLHFEGSGLNLSLRIAMFLIVFGTFAAKSVLDRFHKGRHEASNRWFAALRRSGLFWPYAILLCCIIFAVFRGLGSGNGKANVFFDANGYFYYLLFIPLIATLSVRENRDRLLGVLFAAITASVVKAALVLYVFSHRMFTIAKPAYLWVRDARVGEITRTVGDFYRVFFQSHLFALLALFGILLALVYRRSWQDAIGKRLAAAFMLCCTAMLMSLSRSFWFGAFIAGIGFIAVLVWGKAGAPVWKRAFGIGASGIVVAAALIVFVTAVPIPKKGTGFSIASLLGDRATSLDDAAANSRWALLPKLVEADLRHPILGSGFGTSVTYKTSDPRLLADNPTGEYTTFAFEWGYHDLWLKLGLVGLGVYAWFLLVLLRAAFRGLQDSRTSFAAADGKMKKTPLLYAGVIFGLLALIGTNVFSPYLNHPLGIGTIIAMVAFVVFGQEEASVAEEKSR